MYSGKGSNQIIIGLAKFDSVTGDEWLKAFFNVGRGARRNKRVETGLATTMRLPR